MVLVLEQDGLRTVALEHVNTQGEHNYLCIIHFDQLESVADVLGVSQKTVSECLRRTSASKFESHDGLDLMTLRIPEDIHQRQEPKHICILLRSRLLLFVCDQSDLLNDLVHGISAEKTKNISLGRIMHLFFDRLTADDVDALEEIEQQITDLEEGLIRSKQSDVINDFVAFRRKLMTLKRYYEQLLEICEAIEQNENGFIDKNTMRYFRMLTNRVNRLYSGVRNLRDYVTQVREAYQAQIDISLNQVMKAFTVITSIFLPPTLIVGWYGMNLSMPEYGWRHGYWFVVSVIVLTVASSLFLLKRKKWL